jgi:hypothetical protein
MVFEEHLLHPFSDTGTFKNINKTIEVASGSTLSARKSGRLILKSAGDTYCMGDVAYVPGLKHNLISVGKLLKKGFVVIFEGDQAEILHRAMPDFRLEARRGADDQFHLAVDVVPFVGRQEPESDQLMLAQLKDHDALILWHLRLSHLSYGYIEKAVEKSLVTDMNIPINFKKDIVNSFCEDCQKGKAHDSHGSHGTRDRKYELGEKFHTDLHGPMQVQSRRGNLYWMTLIDDTSNFCQLYFLRHKGEFYDVLVDFNSKIFNRYGRNIKVVRHDNAKEMVSERVAKFFQEKGIIDEPVNTYSSWENNVAERKNLTLSTASRSQLYTAELAKSFWEDSVQSANYVQNRQPHRSNPGWATPFQMQEGRKPSLRHFRIFGSKAMVRIPNPLVKGKLNARAQPCTFVGYNTQGPTVSYRFVTETGAYTTSGNAVFNELPLVLKHSSKTLGENSSNLTFDEYQSGFEKNSTDVNEKDFAVKEPKRVKFSDEIFERAPIRTRSRSSKGLASVVELSEEEELPPSIERVNQFEIVERTRRETAEARPDIEWQELPQPEIGRSNYSSGRQESDNDKRQHESRVSAATDSGDSGSLRKTPPQHLATARGTGTGIVEASEEFGKILANYLSATDCNSANDAKSLDEKKIDEEFERSMKRILALSVSQVAPDPDGSTPLAPLTFKQA